ncbi:hypothetical protein [Micromonospora sp. WMMC250]|uniref:hypothetical protein n=1 Tax=Micromonospora sp. WMMC250 TaxID=3014781 RepID=UPI0022B66101|nr:hypothetical protein [Micromonospora sp. WMMC250]MCZ7377833.1 hypothetical protein [Micromonospora sp. WMMC250]
MQEQPPSEPTRREPAERARRRSPRATFTPPVAAEQPATSAEHSDEATPPAAAAAGQRPRRAKAAPAVLFQPPQPDRALPPQPRRAPTASASDATAERPTPPAAEANSDQPSPPSAEQADPTTRTPKTTTTRATTPKAAPAKATAPKATAVKATAPEADAPQTQRPKARPSQTEASEDPTPPARTTPARRAAARKATEAATEVTPTTPAPTRRAATPRKSATPKKAAPAPVLEQHPALDLPAEQHAVPASGRTPESELRETASRVLDHPGFAPELLALAAVRALGPGAAEWAARLRARYPDAPADGLARLAIRRFVRSAGAGGATAALAGFFAPLAELTSVLWTHANLVLHLAAAYGKDPAHPDRAVELLVLTQVHPDTASAEAALAAAQEAGDPVEGGWPRAAEAAWRLAAPLTAQAGGWVALRLVARLLPGAAMLAAALGDAAAADRLAARAAAVYRPARR